MNVPILDLRFQYDPLRQELLDAVTRVCDSQRFILGPELDAFEREIAERLEVAWAVGVSSGTDALLVSLMALGVGPQDEVVTSTYSFFASAGVIDRLGARPVLVDIDPVTYNVDVEAVRQAVTSRTKAILPVHLFGQSAAMDDLLDIASDSGVSLVEDACQAITARHRGRQVGSMGVAGCFSFFPSKNLGAFGDGGLVVTNDEELAETLKRLRHHGQAETYRHTSVGGNFRMDALQAAVLRVRAGHLDGWTRSRRENAVRYRELFEEAGLTSRVVLPVERPDHHHVFNQYVIRVPDRDRLKQHLKAYGIGTAVYYPLPLHLQPCFAGLGHRAGDMPHAERAAAETLALPIFPGITLDQQRAVVGGVSAFLESPEFQEEALPQA